MAVASNIVIHGDAWWDLQDGRCGFDEEIRIILNEVNEEKNAPK